MADLHSSLPSDLSSRPAFARQKALLSAGCGAIGLGVMSVVWKGPAPLAEVVRQVALHDGSRVALELATDPNDLHHDGALALAVMLVAVGLSLLCLALWRSATERARNRALEWLFTITLSFVLLYALTQLAFEGPWLPLNLLVNHPSHVPIFGHRILFVGLAKLLQKLVPSLTNLRSFYVSQWIAAVLTVYAIGRWSALFVNRPLAWAGQVLAVILMVLCIDYYVFYDIGTVFFTTCALFAIYARRYWLLIPVVLVGTINYEGILLMVPLAGFYAKREPWHRWLPAVSGALVCYILVRIVLQHFIPLQGHVEWHLWTNLDQPFVAPRQIALMLFKGLPWLLLATLSLRYCAPAVRPLALLFPLNLLTSLLFGQMNEIRLFAACIPVLVAIVLSASARQLQEYAGT